MKVTVCTLTRNRNAHLRRQIEGLLRSDTAPAAHVVAVMGGDDPDPHVPDTPWEMRFVPVPSEVALPLAMARNVAARAAGTPGLVLLDVDCIPSRTLIGSYSDALDAHDAILMGEVRYLDPGATEGVLRDVELRRRSQPHPARPGPTATGAVTPTDRYELFWSLSFAIRRDTMFDLVGGFDERYVGYGAEDTDFAFRARANGVPLAWVGGATAFHQHHDTFDPPLQHAGAIVANARRFHQVWGRWPMEGWLARFAAMGIVRWEPDDDILELLREPTSEELDAAHRGSAVPGRVSLP